MRRGVGGGGREIKAWPIEDSMYSLMTYILEVCINETLEHGAVAYLPVAHNSILEVDKVQYFLWYHTHRSISGDERNPSLALFQFLFPSFRT